MQKKVCEWYQQNKRDLPWRNDPTPYHVWVSEIMLQQTRVEAVKPYYARFLEVLPTIESLANASEEIKAPFPHEEELKTKSARLDELNIMLNMDKHENEIIEDGKNEEENSPPEKEMER